MGQFLCGFKQQPEAAAAAAGAGGAGAGGAAAVPEQAAEKEAVPWPSSDETWQVELGAGCYWGTEKYVTKDWGKRLPGNIVETAVGFMSPNSNAQARPNYQEVCSGRTGHVEVLHIEAKGDEKVFEDLLRFFFVFHDPTTMNRQGNDRGSQYASVIFTHTPGQKMIADRVVAEVQAALDSGKLKAAGFAGKKVTTLVAEATAFYPAHQEHQDYLEKNPRGYCNHRIRPPAAAVLLPPPLTTSSA